MPKANLGESLVIVLLVIEVVVQRTHGGGQWVNSAATITLSPLNEQIELSRGEKTASFWAQRRGTVEHKPSLSTKATGASSSSISSSTSSWTFSRKSANVLDSILPSTTPSSIHTSSSSSISHKQTLTTSAVPVASTTVLDHTLSVVKASDRKGGVGDAEAKGPIISSLASVLAISYWQNQRKKCCLNRLCPCRQFPYFPNGNPAGGGVGMMGPGMGPFPGGPFGGPTGAGGFYPGGGMMPGMPGFPGQNRPGGFRPGGGGGGGEEEEELEHGFQGPFEVHTARPPKRRRPSAIKPTVILRPVSAMAAAAGSGSGPHYPINGIKWSAVESSAPSSMSSSELSHEITGTSGLFSPAAQAVSDPLVRQSKVNSRPAGRANDTIELDNKSRSKSAASEKGENKFKEQQQQQQQQEGEGEGGKKIVRAKRKSPQFPWMRVDLKDVLKDALQDGRISDTSQFAQARTSDSAFAWKETTQGEITVRDQVRSAKGIKDLMDISPFSPRGKTSLDKAARVQPPVEGASSTLSKPLLQPPVESVHLLLGGKKRKKRTPPSASGAIVSPVMSLPTLTNGPSAMASMGRINRRNSRKSTTNSDGSTGNGGGNNGANSGANSNSGGGASGTSASGGKKIRGSKNGRMHESSSSTMTQSPRVHRSRNSHRERKG